MRVPLKLNSIEQEHLQELYDAAGVARDELPYSQQFEEICQGFQDRTFKNAEREQVFGAILKYVRSSSNSASGKVLESKVSDDQLKQLKSHLPRHAHGAKLLPYSDEFEAARKEFAKLSSVELTRAGILAGDSEVDGTEAPAAAAKESCCGQGRGRR